LALFIVRVCHWISRKGQAFPGHHGYQGNSSDPCRKRKKESPGFLAYSITSWISRKVTGIAEELIT